MRVHHIAMLLAAVASVLAVGCGGSSGGGRTPEPTIDVSGLTPNVIAERALAALQRDGRVTHIREVRSGSGVEDGTYDLWIDWSGKRVRLDEGGYATQILVDGQASILFDQESIDSPAGGANESDWAASALLLPPIGYLRELRRMGTIRFAITVAQTDGHQGVLADVKYQRALPNARPVTPVSWTEEYKIYLDASFLPLRVERVSDSWIGLHEQPVSLFSTEFVSASALASDFFDKTAALGIGQTPTQRLSFARDTGFTAYWLGETFENATLSDVSGERKASGYSGGVRVLTVDYNVDPSGDGGVLCDAYIVNYPKSIWQEAVDRRRATDASGPKLKSDSVIDDFDVPSGKAQIVEEHSFDVLPPTPGATSTPWPTLVPSSVPSINDVPPPPPKGDVVDTVGRLTAKDYVVEAHLACRASVDEKAEPLKRILTALRPYPE